MALVAEDLAVRPQLPAAAHTLDAVKVYGKGQTEVCALDHVSVDFGTAQFTAIMGPSGSGKSTLLHCCAGLDTLTSGKAFIGGTDLSVLDDHDLTVLRRDHVGFIFQSFNLVPILNAIENIRLPRGSTWSSTRSGCVTGSPTGQASSPVVSSSGWRSLAPSRASRTSSSPTSPPGTSTLAPGRRYLASCGGPSTR
jgi:hypothetical protein